MATTKATELGQLGNKLVVHNENITLSGHLHGQYAGFDSDFTASIASVDTGSLSEGTNLYYTDARADARAQLKIDALVGSAPGALNTLEELGDALGDDANFSTTVTNSIATKLPLAGGTLTGTVNLVDNIALRLGSDDDFRIWFDGTNTNFRNFFHAGGDVRFSGEGSDGISDDALILDFSGTRSYVQLMENGQERVKTTSTGIDVTGTVTANGLNVQNGSNAGITFDLTTNYTPVIKGSQSVSDLYLEAVGGGGFRVSTTDKPRLFIQNNGDISFYEDTGVTAKFFWDASAEKLGIGTTPNNKLTLSDGSTSYTGHGGGTYLEVVRGSGADAGIILNKDTGQWMMGIDNSDGTNPPLRFEYSAGGSAHAGLGNGTVGLTLNYQGNVGIGTGSPLTALHIENLGTGSANFNKGIIIKTGDNSYTSGHGPMLEFRNEDVYMAGIRGIRESGWASGLQFFTHNSSSGNVYGTTFLERMRIDASGNLLVGKTGTSFGTSGVELNPNGSHNMTRSNDPTLALNRLSSDGDILSFYKDSSPVGNISVTGTNDIAIYSTTANHTGLRLGEGYYIPINNTGATADNAVDLGLASIRYKDLYLSGTVFANSRINMNNTNGGIFFGTTGTYGGGGFADNGAIARAHANGYHSSGSIAGDLVIGAERQSDILFGTQSASTGALSTRMRIDSSGRVKIGNHETTIGDQQLFISGTKTSFVTLGYSLWQNQLLVHDNRIPSSGAGTEAGVGGSISFSAEAGGGQKTWLGLVEGHKQNNTAGDYGGGLKMKVRQNGNPTMLTGIAINSDAIVTKPYQPIASFSHSASVNYSQDDLTSANFYSHTWVNQGNHFNASTGRFTCPVAGVYRIYFRATGSGNSNIRLRKNGGTVNEAYENAGTNHSVSSEAVVPCAANDYLHIQIASGNFLSGTQHKQVTFELMS